MIIKKIKPTPKEIKKLQIQEIDAFVLNPSSVFDYKNGANQNASIYFISNINTSVSIKIGPPSANIVGNPTKFSISPGKNGVCSINFKLSFSDPGLNTISFYIVLYEGVNSVYKFNCFLQ